MRPAAQGREARSDTAPLQSTVPLGRLGPQASTADGTHLMLWLLVAVIYLVLLFWVWALVRSGYRRDQ